MWKRFDFFSFLKERFYVDLRSLAICRALIGLVLCLYIPFIWNNFDIFFSDNGTVPRIIAISRFDYISSFPIFYFSDNYFYNRLILIIFFSSALSLMLGYRSRWAAIICWYIYNCLRSRNGFCWHSGDSYLTSILFWMFFLPTDAKFSIRPDPHFSGKNKFYSSAALVFIFQILISYFLAGVAKIQDIWFQGDSIYYALKSGMYASQIGHVLSDISYLRSPFLTIMLVCIEILAPFLIFIRLKKDINRSIFIGVFLCFHLALVILMNLDIFPFVCMSALTALLPSDFWQADKVEAGADSIFIMKLHPMISGFMAIGIALIIMSNINFVDRETRGVLRKTSNFLGIQQNWNLFAFGDNNFGDYWVFVEGFIKDGRKIDVFRDGSYPLYDKPEYTGDSFKNMFWIKYFQTIRRKKYKKYREEFGQYLCMNWNREHTDFDQLKSVNVELRAQAIRHSSKSENWNVFKLTTNCIDTVTD